MLNMAVHVLVHDSIYNVFNIVPGGYLKITSVRRLKPSQKWTLQHDNDPNIPINPLRNC